MRKLIKRPRRVSLTEAKTKLFELVRSREEVIIVHHGQAAARLVPYKEDEQ